MQPNEVFVIGMGGGNPDYLPVINLQKIRQADTLIGARRHVDAVEDGRKKKIYFDQGLQQLVEYIQQHWQSEQLAVLVSGDTGFYSLLRYLKQHTQGIRFSVFTAPSSISILFARLGMMWDDAHLLSAHGSVPDIVQAVRDHQKVALLTDSTITPSAIAAQLQKAKLDNRKIAIGERLTYSDEKITILDVQSALTYQADALCVVVIYDETVSV